ncbi:MAG: succinate dehydrogenase cytochrome b subunit [Oligoflexales bacterium]|nr:succinate dehydrogenase cytochrome b subunit [Oligoflexales bacterium]
MSNTSLVWKKLLMALSGIALVGFLVLHLSGNLLIYLGPKAINAYAERLEGLGPILWVMRIGLIAIAVLHIYTAICLTRRNRQARPRAYAMQKQIQSNMASRTMALSGLVVLSFVCYHLAHLTFRWTHAQAFAGLDEDDVYSMLILSFSSPWVSSFYCVSIVLLMTHLSHGISSFFQTLGLNHSKSYPIIRKAGPTLSLGLALGFLSIPVSIFFGLIK